MLWLLPLLLLVPVALAWLLRRPLRLPPDRGDLVRSIDTELAMLRRPSEPGAWVAGVWKEGRAGVRGVGHVGAGRVGPEPDEHTVFPLGSVTKVFTAALLQRLCDQGRLAPTDRLGDLLGAGWPVADRAAGVTLEQLATHSAGFPSLPARLRARRRSAAAALAPGGEATLDPFADITRADVLDVLHEAEDLEPPGRYRYSHYGVGLLGELLEQHEGRGLESLMVEQLFEPLGMQATRLLPSAEMRSRMAAGHGADGRPARPWSFEALPGAGALHASARDLLRFIAAHFEGPEGATAPASAAADAGPAEAARAASRRGASMSLRGSLERMLPARGNGRTGLGWIRAHRLERRFGLPHIVWHSGRTGAGFAYLAIDPRARCGVVLLSSRAEDVTPAGMMLMRQALTQSWAPRAPGDSSSAEAPGRGVHLDA